MTSTLHQGDCVEVMRAMNACSVDAIVTDPPYHLTTGKKGGTGPASVNLGTPQGRARVTTGFMGMDWDGGDIAQDPAMWAEALRVLKPGGYLLAFSGTRTQHRMVCAIEDAGFEVRDQIGWVYSSGFPKSHNLDNLRGSSICGCNHEKTESDSRTTEGAPGGAWPICGGCGKPVLPNGLGTALKPAWEPICVARKPLIGTVAANVLEHGTGALNIDGCRIKTGDDLRIGSGGIPCRNEVNTPRRPGEASADTTYSDAGGTNFAMKPGTRGGNSAGRWPANLCHDGSDEVVALFPREAGAAAPVTVRNGDKFRSTYGAFAGNMDEGGSTFHADTGSAARFFYCAKASRDDRNDGCEAMDQSQSTGGGGGIGDYLANVNSASGKFGSEKAPAKNHHPTVKPTDLMRYLCRLVTPAGGVVLDPFMGSGSTGRAALLEGFRFIGIEREAQYMAIAQARIDSARRQGHQTGLEFAA